MKPVVGNPLLAAVHIAAAMQRPDVQLAQVPSVNLAGHEHIAPASPFPHLVVVPEDGLAFGRRNDKSRGALNRLLELAGILLSTPLRKLVVGAVGQRKHSAACQPCDVCTVRGSINTPPSVTS